MAKFTPRGVSSAHAGVADNDASNTIHPRIALLAARAESHAASLGTTLNALIALEKLISLECANDSKELAQLRSSLGRLMRALHEDMQRRIGLVADATVELRAVVEKSGLA